LDVPSSHGGLGLYFSGRDFDANLARRVYLHEYLSPFLKSTGVPGYDYIRAMAVPVGIFTDAEMELGGGNPLENRLLDLLLSLDTNPSESSESVDLTHGQFHKDEKIYVTESNTRLLNQLKSSNFRDFPNLDDVRFRTVFVQKGKVGFLKERIIRLALTLLLQYVRNNNQFDPEEGFVDIHRELLEEMDPLFGSLFEISFKEEDCAVDRYSEPYPDLPERIYPWDRLVGPFWDNVFNLEVQVSSDLLRDVPSLGAEVGGQCQGNADSDPCLEVMNPSNSL